MIKHAPINNFQGSIVIFLIRILRSCLVNCYMFRSEGSDLPLDEATRCVPYDLDGPSCLVGTCLYSLERNPTLQNVL